MLRVHGICLGMLLLAAILVIASMSMSDWIIADGPPSAGPTLVGLFQACVRIMERNYECYWPVMNGAWVIAIICIVGNLVCLLAACGFLISSHWRLSNARHGNGLGVFALTLGCLASIIYPASFTSPEIGGLPYQLPQDSKIGKAYILFIASIWVVVAAEISCGRFCVVRF